ncbi:DoxX family protein [Pedococcus soli]
MNTVLWILQIVLALFFAMAGVTKLSQPKEKLRARLPWVEDFSAGTVRFIGAVELLGAIGLVLPAATGIAVVLTPLAAVGLAVVMALAAVTHLRRGEPQALAINVPVLLVAAFVAWQRFGPQAF